MTMVKRPTLEQLQQIVGKLHMSMSAREVGEYLDVLEGTMQAYDRIAQLPDYLPEVRYPRTPGTRPSVAENPLGAWAVKSEIKGAPYGPLAEVWLPPERQKYSQCALPTMVPPASRMRVATVASMSGT